MNKFSTLLALVITILCINFSSVYADGIENANLVTNNTDSSFSLNSSENEKNYFQFLDNNSRINSDGSFFFSFNRGVLHSTDFKAANTTLQVNITATCSVHNDCYYYVFLIKGSSVVDEETSVKKVTYYADGNEWGYTFTGLTVGETYHLDFSKNFSCSGCIDGEGQVTKIK